MLWIMCCDRAKQAAPKLSFTDLDSAACRCVALLEQLISSIAAELFDEQPKELFSDTLLVILSPATLAALLAGYFTWRVLPMLMHGRIMHYGFMVQRNSLSLLSRAFLACA